MSDKELTIDNEELRQIWLEYTKAFDELWGLTAEESEALGKVGIPLLRAELKQWGDKGYQTSIVQPICNAYVACTVTDRYYRAWFEPREPLEEPILDYGCGAGVLIKYLQLRGHRDVYGYDPALPVQLVTKRVGIRMLSESELEPGSFGTIAVLGVLGHLEEPLKTVEYLRTLLKPGGRLIASCSPNGHPNSNLPMEERRRLIEELVRAGEYAQMPPKAQGCAP